MTKTLTLCLALNDGRVLLGMKKRGFGAGKWNGFGGKVQEGETVEEAAKREMAEEASVDILQMERVGLLDFSFKGDDDLMRVHVYRVDSFAGEPQESEEMRPQWFAVDDIPFNEMWADDKLWFPYVLAGKKCKGHFDFDGDEMIGHELEEVASLG